jgi:hypothetical protein
MVVIYYKEHLLGLINGSTFNTFIMDEAGDSRFWRYSYGAYETFPLATKRFTGPAGEERTGLTFSPALFYIGERPERFEKVFAGIGVVWVVLGDK